jgi:hexokinase
LIGCGHLAPSWIFEGHDSLLAVDIGGTNIRCGVVEAIPPSAITTLSC